MRGLGASNTPGLLCNSEQPDARVEPGLVSVSMLANQSRALSLLTTPHLGRAIEAVGADSAVRFVDIHPVDGVLQTAVLPGAQLT